MRWALCGAILLLAAVAAASPQLAFELRTAEKHTTVKAANAKMEGKPPADTSSRARVLLTPDAIRWLVSGLWATVRLLATPATASE